MTTLNVASGGRLSFTGANAGVLLIEADANIMGTIDARSWRIEGGPFNLPGGGDWGGTDFGDSGDGDFPCELHLASLVRPRSFVESAVGELDTRIPAPNAYATQR